MTNFNKVIHFRYYTNIYNSPTFLKISYLNIKIFLKFLSKFHTRLYTSDYSLF